MLLVDRAIGANQGRLDVAERRVHPFECASARCGDAGAGLDDDMLASGVSDRTKACQAVGDDLAGGIEAPLGKCRNPVVAEVDDATQMNAHRLAGYRGLDGGHERCFTGRAATALATCPFAADISIIGLDAPSQTLAGVSLHHHLFEFVLDFPGSCLRDAEATAQFDTRNALLALGEMILSAKPGGQRQFGGGEDGAGDWRGLPAACAALIQPAGLHFAIGSTAASWANEAIRPARRNDHRTAFFLGTIKRAKRDLAETLLKLNLIASHISLLPNPDVHAMYRIRTAEDSA